MKLSKIWIYFSVLISTLVLIASLCGIFIPSVYSKETQNWALQAIGQDIGNLIAVPTLLVSAYFLNKKSTKAFTIWLGSLFYFIYAYLVFALFIHFNFLFLIYVAILGLAFYTIIGGLLEQNLGDIKKYFVIKNNQVAGSLLICIGILFSLLWLLEIIPALINGQIPMATANAGLWVNPIHVIDLAFVLPGMILTGILLIKKNSIGYIFAAPWLCFSVLMGSSIVANLLIEVSLKNFSALVPLIVVLIIVIASLFILYQTLKQISNK